MAWATVNTVEPNSVAPLSLLALVPLAIDLDEGRSSIANGSLIIFDNSLELMIGVPHLLNQDFHIARPNRSDLLVIWGHIECSHYPPIVTKCGSYGAKKSMCMLGVGLKVSTFCPFVPSVDENKARF